MRTKLSAGLAIAMALAMSAPAFAAQQEAIATVASAAAPQSNPLATPQAEPTADPRFAPYCLRDTGSVIVAMQNRRAERLAKANGTTPKLRCTATGIALRVNADGVPVPNQGQSGTRVR